MKRFLKSVLRFLRESWTDFGEAAMASNMAMEGYTDLEIELELNRIKRLKEKANVQHVDESHEGSGGNSSDSSRSSG